MLEILNVKKTLVNVINFCAREKKKPCVKIIENFSFPSREKKNPPVKKSYEVSVKNFDRPWKIPKKCAWKPFSIREKSRKKAKKSFHGHFWFSREKKTLLLGTSVNEKYVPTFL